MLYSLLFLFCFVFFNSTATFKRDPCICASAFIRLDTYRENVLRPTASFSCSFFFSRSFNFYRCIFQRFEWKKAAKKKARRKRSEMPVLPHSKHLRRPVPPREILIGCRGGCRAAERKKGRKEKKMKEDVERRNNARMMADHFQDEGGSSFIDPKSRPAPNSFSRFFGFFNSFTAVSVLFTKLRCNEVVGSSR